MNQKIRLAVVFASLIGLAACSSVKLDDKADGAPIDSRGGTAGSGPGSAGATGATAGREYNLALGQKRSEAVSKALQALGVTGSQLEAVSLGEEKPKATGTDEASFAENRRADLVYQ